MAKIDANAVLEGSYSPRVGDEYEVAVGVWGKMRPPTLGLQRKVGELSEESALREVALLVLDGIDEPYSEDESIPLVEVAVTKDFFTIVARTQALLPEGSNP